MNMQVTASAASRVSIGDALGKTQKENIEVIKLNALLKRVKAMTIAEIKEAAKLEKIELTGKLRKDIAASFRDGIRKKIKRLTKPQKKPATSLRPSTSALVMMVQTPAEEKKRKEREAYERCVALRRQLFGFLSGAEGNYTFGSVPGCMLKLMRVQKMGLVIKVVAVPQGHTMYPAFNWFRRQGREIPVLPLRAFQKPGYIPPETLYGPSRDFLAELYEALHWYFGEHGVAVFPPEDPHAGLKVVEVASPAVKQEPQATAA